MNCHAGTISRRTFLTDGSRKSRGRGQLFQLRWQEFFNFFNQNFSRDRFFDEHRCTGGERFCSCVGTAGDHEDGIGESAVSQMLNHLGAGHFAHAVVGDDHVCAGCEDVLHGVLRIREGSNAAARIRLAHETVREEQKDGIVVGQSESIFPLHGAIRFVAAPPVNRGALDFSLVETEINKNFAIFLLIMHDKTLQPRRGDVLRFCSPMMPLLMEL